MVFPLTVGFALLEPCGVRVGVGGGGGRHTEGFRFVAAFTLVKSTMCGYCDASRL
jgi:hypothetical protein